MQGETLQIDKRDYIDKYFTCGVCKDVYNRYSNVPRQFPCSHQFCEQCINTLIHQEQEHINCPECRCRHEIPENGAQGFPKVLVILKQLEFFNEHKGRTICENCRDEQGAKPAVSFCLDCFAYLCTTCIEAHSRAQALSNHEIQSLSCDTKGHEDRHVAAFCDASNCRKFVCSECFTSDHGECAHVLSNLKRADDISKSKINEIYREAKSVSHSLEFENTIINTEIDELAEYARTLEERIAKHVDVLTSELKEQQKTLVDQLKSRVKEIKSRLVGERSLCKKDIETVHEIEQHLTSFRDQEDQMRLLFALPKIADSIRQLSHVKRRNRRSKPEDLPEFFEESNMPMVVGRLGTRRDSKITTDAGSTVQPTHQNEPPASEDKAIDTDVAPSAVSADTHASSSAESQPKYSVWSFLDSFMGFFRQRPDVMRTTTGSIHANEVAETLSKIQKHVSKFKHILSNRDEESQQLETDDVYFAAKLVDQLGGVIEVQAMNVHLFIPPNALDKEELIYIYVDETSHGNEGLHSDESLLTPTVYCGPPGLKFRRNIILSLPHCAVDDEEWKFATYRVESSQGQWKKDSDMMQIAQNGRLSIFLNHFSSFKVCGTPYDELTPCKQHLQLSVWMKPAETTHGNLP
ncbi:uncharacterized protein [Ptychodera flava]|uniref:uncharacterized protein n=1 Tax=Ptychodera flava TaxID=63121 RepID=UPI00396A5FB4